MSPTAWFPRMGRAIGTPGIGGRWIATRVRARLGVRLPGRLPRAGHRGLLHRDPKARIVLAPLQRFVRDDDGRHRLRRDP